MSAKYTKDKILIFDVDDCLVVTSARIEITDTQTGEVFRLTPEEFNSYEKNEMHFFNFDQFRCLEIMKGGNLIHKYFNVLRQNYEKGIAIGIITARDNREMIYEWFRYHLGFHIDKKLIWAINDPVHCLSGNNSERKQSAMKWFINEGYTDITFFDDDKNNIKLIKQLESELGQSIKTHLAKQ